MPVYGDFSDNSVNCCQLRMPMGDEVDLSWFGTAPSVHSEDVTIMVYIYIYLDTI